MRSWGQLFTVVLQPQTALLQPFLISSQFAVAFLVQMLQWWQPAVWIDLIVRPFMRNEDMGLGCGAEVLTVA